MAISVAASTRRTSAPRGPRTPAAVASTPAWITSSQRWVYGLAAGAAWEADVWGRIRSKKAAALGRERRARSRLRICAAIARRRGSARLFLDHRSRATGGQRAGDARDLSGVFEADRRAERSRATRATTTSRRSSRAPPARRMLFTSRRRRGRRPSARSKLSPATIPPAGSTCAALSPLNLEPCPPVCPRKFSNDAPTSSPPSAASPPPFIGCTRLAPRVCRALSSAPPAGSAPRSSMASARSMPLIWSLAGRGHATDFLRRRTQSRARHPHRRAKSRRRELRRRRFARLRGRRGRALWRLLSAQTRRRARRNGFGQAEAVKLGREQLDQGQMDMFTILRLGRRKSRRKNGTHKGPRLSSSRTRESLSRPRRRFRGNRRAKMRMAPGLGRLGPYQRAWFRADLSA